MARQARQTWEARFQQLERHVSTERVRRKGITEQLNWIAGNVTITTGLILPSAYIGLDVDGETPQWKRLIAINGLLDEGTATIGWELNNEPLTETVAITYGVTGPDVYLATPIDLRHGDVLRPVINAVAPDGFARDPFGLTATAFLTAAIR